MDAVEQQRLMLQAAKGDQRAFRLLAHALTQRMMNLAFRLLNYRRDLAEDAVQEALLKLWRTAPRWQPLAPVSSYAARLVYTSAMDIHRRSREFSEVPETMAADDDVAENVATIEENEILLTAVHQLPERQRDAVLFHYMGEQTHGEVAQQMGTTEKAVERLLARARENLRGNLDGMERMQS